MNTDRVSGSAARDGESVTACCDGATYPFVNDAAMNSVRKQFTTADSMLKNVGYDGKQIKHELSLMFAELAMWRRSGVASGGSAKDAST